jgi:hypothetical protein
MLGIKVRLLDALGEESSSGDTYFSEVLGNKNSPTEAEVTTHGNNASKVQWNNMLAERIVTAPGKKTKIKNLYYSSLIPV